jgi:hypothetical protein
MAARGFLGSGDLYIARYDTALQAFGPLVGPYECSRFEIKPNVDVKELTSRGKSTYGQVIESVALNQPADFTCDLPEVNTESLSIALLGTPSAINQSAATVAAEAWTDIKVGTWHKLANRNIAGAGFAVKNGDTTVPAAEYQVNYALGMVKVLPGGSLDDGDDVTVGYTAIAETGTLIRGATQSQLRAKFVLDGANAVDGSPVTVTVHEAVVAPDSAFDFMGDDFATVSLPGRLKTPAGFTEPFTVQVR